jgi:FkbM family methyltransferase
MPSPFHQDRLDGLFQLDPDQATQRCQKRFKERSAELKKPLLLWGCGPLGSHVAKVLKGSKLEVGAFIDKREEMWGKTFQTHPVIAPDSLREERYRHCLVVITIYTSEPLRKLLTEWEIPFLTFPELAWGMPELFLPHQCLDYPNVLYSEKEGVVAALNGWADDASREEYLGQLEWRLTMDYAALPPHLSARETYFPSGLVSLQSNEHYVDCGAFDGDSIRELLVRTGGRFDRITAFEPDTLNYEHLVNYSRQLPDSVSSRMRLFNKGVGDKITESFLNETGTVGSNIGETGSPVSLTTLDSALENEAPTYIKMDIEGFEPFALKGGAKILQMHRPVLAICLYHSFAHLWSIPNLLHALVPDYQLHLVRHSDECWESVCYAIPPSRTKTG